MMEGTGSKRWTGLGDSVHVIVICFGVRGSDFLSGIPIYIFAC